MSADQAIDPTVHVEYCSYCERKTDSWCSECFGCATCCPDHVHCDECGQSTLQCAATCCGGQGGDDRAAEAA